MFVIKSFCIFAYIKFKNMKKIIYFLLVLTLSACSTPELEQSSLVDTQTENNQQGRITPPNWIHGTWLLNPQGSAYNLGFTFEPNDVIVTNLSTITSLNSTLTPESIVVESKTDTYYSIQIDYINNTSVFYEFHYLNEQLIQYGTSSVLTKQ